MAKPITITGPGAQGPVKLPNDAEPRPPPQEVLEEAARTGRGLDQITREAADKVEPKSIPWPAAKPLESGGKPFKL